VGPAGLVLATNIKRIRTAQRLGIAELSRKLSDIGRDIPQIGLRRIEVGERRIDADDLMALSYVLKVAVVDLLIDKDATTEPYSITPKLEYTSESVRNWIAGQDIRLAPIVDPDSPFASPGTWMWPALEQMPSERRRQVMRKHGEEEEES
jgi:hypothetical protein